MTISTYTIRPATRDDIPALEENILAMALESEGRALDKPTLDAGIRAVFDRPALGTYWVIADGEQRIVGGTLMTIEWSDWNNAEYWWFQSVFIAPEARGQGLFEQLLQTIESAAKAAGVAEIRLYVEQNNTRAIRVYERNGFDGEHYRCMIKTDL